MIEPWDIRPEITRQVDFLSTFIIFCEDEVSEPIYFKYFETSLIKVNPIKKQKSKMSNVIKAICYCEQNGLMESESSLNCSDTQVWCVYDRDIEETESDILQGNVDFDEAIRTANGRGIKVAWSNDAFELWVLLHFEDIDITDSRYKNRLTYYERLTEIFKSLPNPNEDLVAALKHPSFSYKQDFKHENNFRNIVRNEIVARTKKAIERAKIIEAFHSTNAKSSHEKSPCTFVHCLVEELIRLGGKDV
jgi:hypothetical protein